MESKKTVKVKIRSLRRAMSPRKVAGQDRFLPSALSVFFDSPWENPLKQLYASMMYRKIADEHEQITVAWDKQREEIVDRHGVGIELSGSNGKVQRGLIAAVNGKDREAAATSLAGLEDEDFFAIMETIVDAVAKGKILVGEARMDAEKEMEKAMEEIGEGEVEIGVAPLGIEALSEKQLPTSTLSDLFWLFSLDAQEKPAS